MKNIEVFVWSPFEGLPSSSPFCLKVIYALQYKKLDHRVTVVDRPPNWVTRGKLPAVRIEGRTVEDSTNILKLLDELQPNGSRLYPTDERERAETLLLEDWSDEALYWLLVYYRWAVKENFEKFKVVAFKNLPAPLRFLIPTLIRKNTLNRLDAQGISKLPPEERLNRVNEAVWCLEQKLQDRNFLVNQTITAADLAVFSVLQIIEKSQFSDLSGIFTGCPLLHNWLTKLEETLANEQVLNGRYWEQGEKVSSVICSE